MIRVKQKRPCSGVIHCAYSTAGTGSEATLEAFVQIFDNKYLTAFSISGSHRRARGASPWLALPGHAKAD
ncbi:hypothetical protein SBA3_200019 [Candidatus Sulfopaludibacter sp. SbA3]|nr:hypothetical protein SBA3_200019 [Candidatus Sulfopaludibacter sp. SbA3]